MGAAPAPARRHADLRFLGVTALAMAAAVAAWDAAMRAMAGMAVLCTNTAAMSWLPPPGGTWTGVLAAFLAMWTAMAVAMMLPSVAPALWRYRGRLHDAGTRRADGLAAMAGAGYFCTWMLIGLLVFPLGAAVAVLEARVPALARLAPAATGLVVLAGGLFQLTAFKARHLAACGAMRCACPGAAWRDGLRLGLRCGVSCAGLTASLLAVGMMDWRAMAFATAATAGERLLPGGPRVARITGGILATAGAFMLARATPLA
ncbi:MAG: hypothetical protein ABS43_18765 [Bordetella sp. SCN 67-23]|nr:MAG: hypothetical protein ABS43_18765 [Bordetella sp. SCN 67-23]ODU67182.1 MAG: hypothetical protein ABT00_21080 [Bordetella sp. SCN 68-11]OJW86211.1 MAG: hypothetical protein BGO71_13010 [Burkholderiales bacterium 67-32]